MPKTCLEFINSNPKIENSDSRSYNSQPSSTNFKHTLSCYHFRYPWIVNMVMKIELASIRLSKIGTDRPDMKNYVRCEVRN
jgi:hypothetical protein